MYMLLLQTVLIFMIIDISSGYQLSHYPAMRYRPPRYEWTYEDDEEPVRLQLPEHRRNYPRKTARKTTNYIFIYMNPDVPGDPNCKGTFGDVRFPLHKIIKSFTPKHFDRVSKECNSDPSEIRAACENVKDNGIMELLSWAQHDRKMNTVTISVENFETNNNVDENSQQHKYHQKHVRRHKRSSDFNQLDDFPKAKETTEGTGETIHVYRAPISGPQAARLIELPSISGKSATTDADTEDWSESTPVTKAVRKKCDPAATDRTTQETVIFSGVTLTTTTKSTVTEDVRPVESAQDGEPLGILRKVNDKTINGYQLYELLPPDSKIESDSVATGGESLDVVSKAVVTGRTTGDDEDLLSTPLSRKGMNRNDSPARTTKSYLKLNDSKIAPDTVQKVEDICREWNQNTTPQKLVALTETKTTQSNEVCMDIINELNCTDTETSTESHNSSSLSHSIDFDTTTADPSILSLEEGETLSPDADTGSLDSEPITSGRTSSTSSTWSTLSTSSTSLKPAKYDSTLGPQKGGGSSAAGKKATFIELLNFVDSLKDQFYRTFLETIQTEDQPGTSPSLLTMVEKMLGQMTEIRSTHGYLAILSGGNVSDLKNCSTDLVRTLHFINNVCDKQNTIVILTATCPWDNRGIPFLVSGPSYKDFESVEELGDIANVTKRHMLNSPVDKRAFANQKYLRNINKARNNPNREQYSLESQNARIVQLFDSFPNDRYGSELQLAEALVQPPDEWYDEFAPESELFEIENKNRMVKRESSGYTLQISLFNHFHALICFLIVRLLFC